MADQKLNCRHLCSKVVSTEEITSAFDLPAGHFWCLCTMGEVGPDDEVVDADMCLPQRECFEVELES